ncbi:MAG: hypothetical protein AAF399_02860 [Bacteroidota bacterium]
MSHMQEIELITNRKGEITGLKLEVNNDPELAQEVIHLIGVLERVKETTNPPTQESSPRSAMSVTAFNKLIRKAKASGELTEAEFFQLHPAWQKNAKLSLRA